MYRKVTNLIHRTCGVASLSVQVKKSCCDSAVLKVERHVLLFGESRKQIGASLCERHRTRNVLGIATNLPTHIEEL